MCSVVCLRMIPILKQISQKNKIEYYTCKFHHKSYKVYKSQYIFNFIYFHNAKWPEEKNISNIAQLICDNKIGKCKLKCT